MPMELFATAGAAGARGATGSDAASTSNRKPQASSSGDGFAASLGRLIEGVEQTAGDANVAIANMLDKSGEVHDAMIALQRADMSLQLTVQIRNKLVQAYQDIMRMPI
ncbi:MAG: flagellar hook-basal body complex protein FliE [Acidobacteria bacterium]|nr:flagellar hook-basal body complex protein FliE [Acidobacteriota bacterium]